MKVIFLDIDGVLNGYNFWNLIGWRIVCLFHIEWLREWYRKISDPCGVHESKVKRLAKIVHSTNAKIVMSSSWRSAFWYIPYEEKTWNLKKLADLFIKYNIEVIDITPRSPRNRRDDEIISWLSKHEDEVDKFVILDDEKFDLECFADKELVQTLTVKKLTKTTGLKREHVKQAIKILGGA